MYSFMQNNYGGFCGNDDPRLRIRNTTQKMYSFRTTRKKYLRVNRVDDQHTTKVDDFLQKLCSVRKFIKSFITVANKTQLAKLSRTLK